MYNENDLETALDKMQTTLQETDTAMQKTKIAMHKPLCTGSNYLVNKVSLFYGSFWLFRGFENTLYNKNELA